MTSIVRKRIKNQEGTQIKSKYCQPSIISGTKIIASQSSDKIKRQAKNNRGKDI